MTKQEVAPPMITSEFGCWQCGQIKDTPHTATCPVSREARRRREDRARSTRAALGAWSDADHRSVNR